MTVGEAGNDLLKQNQSGAGLAGRIPFFPKAAQVVSSQFSSLITAILGFLRALVQGKVRISATAGVCAGLLVATGFLLFDANKEEWTLKRRYPQAVNSAERHLLLSRDLFSEGELEKAEGILRGLLKDDRLTGVIRADSLLLLAETVEKSEHDEAADEEARGLYKDFIAGYPADPRMAGARALLAENFSRVEFFSESNSEYENLLRAFPEAGQPDIEFLIARNYHRADNSPRAIGMLKHIQEEAPEADVSFDARLLLGRIYAEMGNREESESRMELLIQDAPGTLHAASALRFLAQNAWERQAYQETIEYCTRWFAESPTVQGRDDIMLLLGRAYLALHEPVRAAEAASDVITFFSESPAAADAFILRGKAFEALQRPGGAESAYREAIRAFPRNSLPYKELARLKLSMGDVGEAVQLIEQVRRQHPDDEATLVELAKLYWANGENVKAEGLLGDFIRERQLSPKIGEAFLLLAEIQSDLNQPDMAYTTLERLLATGTATVEQQVVFERQGDILARAGLHGDALEAYLWARKKDGNSPVLTLKAAKTLFDLGRVEESLKELSSVGAASLSPAEQFEMLHLQARAQAHLGNAQEAHRLIHRALALRSGREKISILALLMQVNLALGNEREASKVFDVTHEIIATENVEAPLEARQIVLDWAERLYQKQEYMQAAKVYSSVSLPQFSSSEGAWAAYQAGNCYYKLADFSGARKAYSKLRTDFPDSEWMPFAEQRTKLIDLMANALPPAGKERTDDARID